MKSAVGNGLRHAHPATIANRSLQSEAPATAWGERAACVASRHAYGCLI